MEEGTIFNTAVGSPSKMDLGIRKELRQRRANSSSQTDISAHITLQCTQAHMFHSLELSPARVSWSQVEWEMESQLDYSVFR